MEKTSIKSKIFNRKNGTILSVVIIVLAVFSVVTALNYGKININDATIISTHENIFSKVDGEIFEIFANEGDSVKQGDLLLKIFPAKYELTLKKLESKKIQTKKELAQAEKNLLKRTKELDLIKKDCDRNQSMFDEDISTKTDFDRSINELETANSVYFAAKKETEDLKNKLSEIENEIAHAKIDLENTNVLAAEDGEITSVFAQKNEKISKDKLLFSINSNRFVIVVPMVKKSFSKIIAGQPVMMKLKNNHSEMTGKIDKILQVEDFLQENNMLITEKCTVFSVKTDENYSGEIDGFQDVRMTIQTK